jgi:uncharacterized protein (DUF2237 family)
MVQKDGTMANSTKSILDLHLMCVCVRVVTAFFNNGNGKTGNRKKTGNGIAGKMRKKRKNGNRIGKFFQISKIYGTAISNNVQKNSNQ